MTPKYTYVRMVLEDEASGQHTTVVLTPAQARLLQRELVGALNDLERLGGSSVTVFAEAHPAPEGEED